MAWFERLNRPGRTKKPVGAPRAVKLKTTPGWFAEERPERLSAMRLSAERARRKRPKDPWAHAAFAAALIAGIRAGLTDDLHEDALAALEAADRALRLAPADPFIKALAAPALVRADPARAADLFTEARRKLGRRLPETLVRAAEEGARRPAMR
jgi:hypothetical protein